MRLMLSDVPSRPRPERECSIPLRGRKGKPLAALPAPFCSHWPKPSALRLVARKKSLRPCRWLPRCLSPAYATPPKRHIQSRDMDGYEGTTPRLHRRSPPRASLSVFHHSSAGELVPAQRALCGLLSLAQGEDAPTSGWRNLLRLQKPVSRWPSTPLSSSRDCSCSCLHPYSFP